MDNGHVFPYHTNFLLKYHAHINMEWCNQSTSNKCLFKYIHKGYERIITSIVPCRQTSLNDNEIVDEIKQYLDCRYVCEASWRIFPYNIHGRKAVVECMFFHLIGEKSVYYSHFYHMENNLDKESVTKSMFLSWLITNQNYVDAMQLT